MPWLVKGLFVLAKSRKARQLLFVGGLAAIEVAQGEQARKLYAKAGRSARRAAQAIRSIA
jgi:hypothetical protein